MPCCRHVCGWQPASGAPHTPALPPPPQVWPVGQEPQARVPPQPSPAEPQLNPCPGHVSLVHAPLSGRPHTLALPAPPQSCPLEHVPHPPSIRLPHVSLAGPQLRPCCPQVSGVHDDVVLGTHEERSQIMYSRIRSCDVRSAAVHSFGNVVGAFGSAPLTVTWKSLKMPCPHCVTPASAVAATGVLNVKCSSISPVPLFGSVADVIHGVEVPATLSTS